MTKTIHPWASDRPVSSPFAHPEGLVGSLAGWLMLWTYDDKEVFDLLEVRPGHEVLEVGFGPGGFLRRIAAMSPRRLVGVDCSERMLRDAARRNRGSAVPIDLRLGEAERTGLDAASFDRVASIHNVALWPDLERGLDELHRVLRPGGMLLLAWHGGRTNPWMTASLRLPDERLARIEAALAQRFERVERISATRDDVFRAWV